DSVGLAVPLRTRPAHHCCLTLAGRVAVARVPPALVALPRRTCRRRGSLPPRGWTPPGSGHAPRTALCDHHNGSGPRLADCLEPARPAARPVAPGTVNQRYGAGGAMVGTPATPRQGPCGAHARRVARDRRSRGPGRLPCPVSGGRRVGLAGPVRPGTRPDDP